MKGETGEREGGKGASEAGKRGREEERKVVGGKTAGGNMYAVYVGGREDKERIKGKKGPMGGQTEKHVEMEVEMERLKNECRDGRTVGQTDSRGREGRVAVSLTALALPPDRQ